MTGSSVKVYKRLVMSAGIASVTVAAILIAMKFTVWLISGSSTVLASLTDSMMDSMASVCNLIAMRFAIKPADNEHRFGHFKAESLSCLAQAAFIGGSAILLVISGIDRLKSPQIINYVDLAILTGVISIVLTLILVAFQGYVCKRTQSQAVGADRYHYVSDVLLNLGVILSLGLSRFGYMWADGLFAILLGLYILRGALVLGRRAIATLLDVSMDPLDREKILKAIISTQGVNSLHDLKTRQAGPQVFIQCHLVLDSHMPLLKAHHIATAAENNVRQLFPDAEIIIHMEPDDAETQRTVQFKDDSAQLPADSVKEIKRA